jgi:hypothetical protein
LTFDIYYYIINKEVLTESAEPVHFEEKKWKLCKGYGGDMLSP